MDITVISFYTIYTECMIHIRTDHNGKTLMKKAIPKNIKYNAKSKKTQRIITHTNHFFFLNINFEIQ